MSVSFNKTRQEMKTQQKYVELEKSPHHARVPNWLAFPAFHVEPKDIFSNQGKFQTNPQSSFFPLPPLNFGKK